MILADTSILIDFHRKPTEPVRRILQTQTVFICGVVRAEVLVGARTDSDYDELLKALEEFPVVEVTELTWTALGRNLRRLRLRGLVVPFPDALIATLAIENDLPVWSTDKHYPAMTGVLTELKLFTP